MINTSLEASGTSNEAAENRRRYIRKARVQYFRTDTPGPLDQYSNATGRKDAASLSAITPSMNGSLSSGHSTSPFSISPLVTLSEDPLVVHSSRVPFSLPVRA